MRGMDRLIAMRMRGVKPAAVWLDDLDVQDGYGAAKGDNMHIAVEPMDRPESLDLRPLVGLEVHIHADRGESRARALFSGARGAGAKLVAGVHLQRVSPMKWSATWAEVWTQGGLKG